VPVPDADGIVPILNRWLAAAEHAGLPVVAARDWHPPDHCTFAEHGGSWPSHCVRETTGAEFHPDLRLPPSRLVISKGTRPASDGTSAFDDTGLAQQLHERGIARLWVGGLAQEGAIRASVIDACEAGFEAVLIPGAVRAREAIAGDGQRALEAMRAAGATLEVAT
jgi:nicotinamidase/pyrazinamidase